MKTSVPTDHYRALKDLIIENLLVDAEDIKPSSDLMDDLGADSAEIEELFGAIEQKWGVEIPEEVADRLRTIQDVVEYLEDQSEL
jgi:acyl carrier protein